MKYGPLAPNTYQLDEPGIQAALDALADRDADVARVVETIGYPPPRRRPAGFATVLRVIVGQQLSVKAAATIFGRLEASLEGDLQAARLLALTDETLRGAGLSRPKVRYVRALADAELTGRIDFDRLPSLSDAEVTTTLTAIPGLGVWSAHMYLMFALGRPDVWPSGDLAVRASVGAIKGCANRPTAAEAERLAAPWSPHRSAAAMLCWHYAHNTAL